MPEEKKTTVDQGHADLVADLKGLLDEAEKFAFHDFKNTDYAAPKMMLVEKLKEIADKAMDGKYDN